MNLQNGYKVIYEKVADGTRTFYATKNTKCDPTVDDKIIEATIGEYKLIYEKDGNFYGSLTGIPAKSVEDDFCFSTSENFKKVFIAGYEAKETEETEEDEPIVGESPTEPNVAGGENPQSGEAAPGDEGTDN